MLDFELKILGSSSKGNCYILRTSTETLLLECGVSFKDISKGLNYGFGGLVGCLVTHEHGDHSKAIKDLTQRGVDVYSSQETFIKLGIKSHRAKPIEAKKTFSLGGFRILPFKVEHDALKPLGFLIEHKEIGRLLFATDTYFIQYKFRDLNYIMIECNFSKKIVSEKYDNGEIHPQLLKRLLNSHMSLENLKTFLRKNDLTKVKEIFLMHLSEKNSDPLHFKKSIEKLTGIITTIC